MKKLLLLLIIPIFFSCKKENHVRALVGKWTLTEIYSDGYSGCSCWMSVQPSMASTLEFTALGRYKLTQPLISSLGGCQGSYYIVDDSTISMTFECYTPVAEHRRKYSRIGDTLILDLPDITGFYRYKYAKQ